uniref:Myeloid leukemia factor 1 n=1 Tax=Ananas comosus var. bracteatus TaxID=296719 RepID=A0A6V7QCQ1_ANACO|nr:unnamed protein product [Ananas comosus var. bracteatus]
MERRGGGRNDFFGFGDPFTGFGGGRDDLFGFGDPFAGFGGFGRPGTGSLVSSFFGGRNPFDDPFFTRPFGYLMGPSMFDPRPGILGDTGNTGFIEQAPPPSKPRGPVIKELNSDDEEEDEEEKIHKDKKDNPRKHSRSSEEPDVQHPVEETEEKRSRLMEYKNGFQRASTSRSKAHAYTFQSSTVTYGGRNASYYTSSTTRRTGGDGVTVEESKEADTTTGRATHRISRGIRDKGHSVTRKLNSDGRVDTMQTLHNLNELAGFEEAWKGKARQHLPGWNPSSTRDASSSNSSSRGWALPGTERAHDSAHMKSRPPADSFKRRA